MASKNKTIAGIIAEKRRLADITEASYPENPRLRREDEAFVVSLRYDADRLEAAYKREMGNAAKMREALMAIRDAIKEHPYQLDEDAVYNICTEALAAPPRNCDVGTAEEQIERGQGFCKRYDEDCTGCHAMPPTPGVILIALQNGRRCHTRKEARNEREV